MSNPRSQFETSLAGMFKSLFRRQFVLGVADCFAVNPDHGSATVLSCDTAHVFVFAPPTRTRGADVDHCRRRFSWQRRRKGRRQGRACHRHGAVPQRPCALQHGERRAPAVRNAQQDRLRCHDADRYAAGGAARGAGQVRFPVRKQPTSRSFISPVTGSRCRARTSCCRSM